MENVGKQKKLTLIRELSTRKSMRAFSENSKYDRIAKTVRTKKKDSLNGWRNAT